MAVKMRNMMVMAVALVLAAPMVRAETLTDALIAAYRNSHLLEQNRAVLRAADEDVATAVSALRPALNFVASSTYSDNETTRRNAFGQASGRTFVSSFDTTLQLTAQLTVFDSGRNRLGIEIAKESVLATREALIRVEQDVLLEAVTAYVDVRLAQDVVALRQSNMRLIEQERQAAKDRFEVGEITRTDVAIAEAQLAASESGLASAQGDLTVARERYRAAVGAYPGKLAPLPPMPKTAKSVEEAMAVALQRHPNVLQAQRQVRVAELNIELARAAMRPEITLEAQASTDDSGFQRSAVGLSGTQTLYTGGRLSALVRQAMANRDQARGQLLQTSLILGQNVGNAWSSVEVAEANIVSSISQIESAQIAYDGVREEATLGARTTLDVLDQEQELLNARNTKLQAEAQRYVGVYTVLSTMGLLTVEHLKLGIPTYDPAAYYNAVKKAPAVSSRGKKLDAILEKIGK